jgi:hypothetical protein
MKLGSENARIFSLSELPLEQALGRTTHLGVGAHADDLEIMAAHGILACLDSPDRWFSGVIVADGAGGPRAAAQRGLSDADMRELRAGEQRAAAELGQYSALALCGYSSGQVRSAEPALLADLRALLLAASPEVVYTHNLADAHDTHVAVALRLLEACRALPQERRPKRVLGCEVWRDLDWLTDTDKIALRVDGHEALKQRLIAAHASQLAAGKRYDLAALGRQRAHATFSDSQSADRAEALSFAMDLTPLLADDAGTAEELVHALIARFEQDVHARLARVKR